MNPVSWREAFLIAACAVSLALHAVDLQRPPRTVCRGALSRPIPQRWVF